MRSEAFKSEPAKPATESPVDTSGLDQLIEITRQQRQLHEFAIRAEQKKDKVTAAVYRRVVDDYQKRHAALEDQARPLKAQARQEFEKLRAMFDAVNGREQRARDDKQELEFRHDVGEIDDEQLTECLKAPEATLDECRVELAALGEQRARFLEAFDEEELATPAREDPANVIVELDTPGEKRIDPTVVQPDDPSTPFSPSQPIPTLVASATGAGEPSGERTFLLPEAMLVVGDADGGAEVEYQLSTINYIGRSEDNQIRILRAGVSRRHAVIEAENTDFIIRDLHSQNGTFVNDAPVEESVLSDGDIIRLGEALLVFRIKGRAGF